MATKYFCFLAAGISTVRASRFQVIPVNGGVVQKGVSFQGSQGVPVSVEKKLILSIQHEKEVSCLERGERLERSRMGKQQSSLNSSKVSSGRVAPRYHLLPPLVQRLPLS